MILKTNIQKFIFKVLAFLPLIFILIVISRRLKFAYWISYAIGSLLLSFGFIFCNVFDYEKFDSIANNDFLDSKHFFIIDKSAENWLIIEEMIKEHHLKVISVSDGKIICERNGRLVNSLVTFHKTAAIIEVEIEIKYFKFLPDYAANYKFLLNLKKKF